ncbi:MAG: hypothetical protein JWM11_1707 [Planctomycetaceae bacterium]|nr:hypothetical protein [Planctomycetaceae bacterium]
MSDPDPKPLGGVIHTYQKYDPAEFPSPTQPPPDMVSGAFEHMLMYGDMSQFSEEDLAKAIKLDISQIKGFGPSIESLKRKLLERKRKILETYETGRVQKTAERAFIEQTGKTHPPGKLAEEFQKAVKEEQLRDLERLWYRAGDDRSKFAGQLVQLVERLGEKYQIDQLARKYDFTGRKFLTVDEALDVKRELEKIDKLLKQLEEAAKNAQLYFIDMEELSEYASQQDMDELSQIQQQIAEQLRHMAEQQGLQKDRNGYQLTPQAYRLFQGRLLERIFSQLQSSRTGRHSGPILGDGAVELQSTKEYEFGDSLTNMDIPASLVNAMLRGGSQLPIRMKTDDIVIHRTRNNPKCATSVLLDMSGSMRYGGLYMNVKRMALALDGLIRREYPGDFLQFIEMYSIARQRHASEIVTLLPKPVTIFDPVVRLRADMSRPELSEEDLPPHFTNIQHALQLGRQFLQAQNTPNRQIILITDGLPTAHFEGKHLFFLYPPDPRTEAATLREAQMCKREGIVINMFLLASASQSQEDIRFAHKLAEQTKGRVFFTAGRDLDRYVVWDYVNRRKQIIS